MSEPLPVSVAAPADSGGPGRPPADLVGTDASAEALTHNALNAATGGIWRVTRNGRSAVLKIATPGRDRGLPQWASSDDPGHWNYWRRELLAYRSGLAATAFAEGGVRAPELLDTVARPDGSVGLWLADVPGRTGGACRPDDLGDLAARLGTAQAARMADLPDHPWLARDWLRDYVLSRDVTEPVDWDHPVAVRWWPARLRDRLRRLWERRRDVLAATDRLPRTLCHHDVWPMNLVVDADGPVLLDWACVGPGPVGEDAANLILDTFFDGLVDVALLDEVATAVIDGYTAGMRGVIAADEVRRAIRLTAAAKYCWLAPRMLNLAAGAGGRVAATYDRRGQAEVFAARAPLLALLTDWLAAD
ncbi:phosphotransferase [Micromonospora sp. HM5-17]|uniref:phosphotransferase n=1 Tax=Micromonospora sp. HM5-17 TaxID=2487710 RepID=UPI001F24BE19|nr:phosphotransferase [Micromonospora sp. HM5-17]